MRVSFDQQPKLNQILISDVEIDFSSRDEIPQILICFKPIKICGISSRDEKSISTSLIKT